jgi:hypothetical protein
VYHELALRMISSTVVTARGIGSQGFDASVVDTMAPSIRPFRRAQPGEPGPPAVLTARQHLGIDTACGDRAIG